MINGSQAALVAETLRVSLLHAAAETESGTMAQAFVEAGVTLPENADSDHAVHPALPARGRKNTREIRVTEADTAAAMGHPDASMDVLGSPRISLWFEVVASGLLPAPTTEFTHVGVGIVVHHLARARVGDRVTVEATVETVADRRIVFSCVTRDKSGVLALGTHQRMLLTR